MGNIEAYLILCFRSVNLPDTNSIMLYIQFFTKKLYRRLLSCIQRISLGNKNLDKIR